MQVGLIPPKGLENYALRSKFHLALAIPELMDRRPYGGMYRRARKLGDFVVIDNGLAEGMPQAPEVVFKYGHSIQAQEVVLPDVMKDSGETIDKVLSAIKRDLPKEFSYMAVAQGKKLDDFQRCVDLFAKHSQITTVGLPRHMLTTLQVKSSRINLARWIDWNYPGRFAIHFLGTNPVWIPEVRSAARYTPFVRSVDTSMPFSYAIAGEDLAVSTKEITRPQKYFDQDWSFKVVGHLVRNNIDTLLEWANAPRDSRTEAPVS